MSDHRLYKDLVKLGMENIALRKHLRPLLSQYRKQAAGKPQLGQWLGPIQDAVAPFFARFFEEVARKKDINSHAMAHSWQSESLIREGIKRALESVWDQVEDDIISLGDYEGDFAREVLSPAFTFAFKEANKMTGTYSGFGPKSALMALKKLPSNPGQKILDQLSVAVRNSNR